MKRFTLLGGTLGFLIAVGAIVAGAPLPSWGQAAVPIATGTFTSATSSPAILSMSGGQSSAYYHQVGTPGPIDVYGSNDGTHFTLLNVYSVGGTLLASNTGTPAFPYTGSSGVEYQIWPVGFAFIYIEPDASWSGQSSTILARSSASVAQRQGPSGAPGATGPSGPPGNNANLVAGPCITISPTASPSPGGQVVSVYGSGCTPSPAPSPVVSPTACGGAPSVGPGGTIIIPAGCATSGSGGAVIYSPGVPTNAPAQTAQFYVATDTLWSGMERFTYRGQYANMPWITNRCIYFNGLTSGSHTPTQTCERTFTTGHVLLSMLIGFDEGETFATAASGWTSLFNDTGGFVGGAADWQIISSASSPAPWAFTNGSNQLAVTVELANAFTPSPIPTYVQGGASPPFGNPPTTYLSSLTANSLVIGMSGCYAGNGGGSPPIYGNGSFLLAGYNSVQYSMGAQFWAVPQIAPYTYGNTGYVYAPGCNGFAALFVIAGASATANWWDVVGRAKLPAPGERAFAAVERRAGWRPYAARSLFGE